MVPNLPDIAAERKCALTALVRLRLPLTEKGICRSAQQARPPEERSRKKRGSGSGAASRGSVISELLELTLTVPVLKQNPLWHECRAASESLLSLFKICHF